ncbi:MAG: radical SAM protein [Nannocystaceae bacterium]
MDFDGFEKLIYHHEKIVKIRGDRPQFPVHITLSLGNYCNHKCRWCTVFAHQEGDIRHADADRILGFLDKGKARGLAAVGYVGNGEPTAYPGFDAFTTRVHEMGLEQGMFTNGYLLHRHMEAVLSYFTYVRISLDAGSTPVHDAMHVVNGHFDRIIANVREIIRRRRNSLPTVGIQYVTHHENLDDLPRAAALASELQVDYLNVKPVFNWGGGRVPDRIPANNLKPEELDRAVAEIRAQYETRSFKIQYKPFQIEAVAADSNILRYGRCVAGFFNLSLYETGVLVACGPHRVEVGTVDDSIEEIEARVMELTKSLDLSNCPAACRYHPLNHIVDTVLHPEHGREYHKNFL